MNAIKQGRILRDTSVKDGLVLVEKQQYLFRLEGMWRGDVAPKVNMLVDVEFNERGQLVGLQPASAPDVAVEQASRAIGAATETAKRIAEDAKTDGVPFLLQKAQQVGYGTLAAIAALLLGWFYFAAATMNMGAGGKLSFTFYQVLKLLNIEGVQDLMNLASGGGGGVYGLLCFAALLAVLLPWLSRNPKAGFGMMAPLVFMVVIAIIAHFKMKSGAENLQQAASSVGAHGGTQGRDMATQFANQVVAQARASLAIGWGAWLSLAGSLYLAWRGWRTVSQSDGKQSPQVAARTLA
jgi:hypothetical protein